MVWTCLPFIRYGQKHLASERGKNTKQTENEDIKNWTGLEFALSQRAVKNRKKWKKLVVKLSVMPQ